MGRPFWICTGYGRLFSSIGLTDHFINRYQLTAKAIAISHSLNSAAMRKGDYRKDLRLSACLSVRPYTVRLIVRQ